MLGWCMMTKATLYWTRFFIFLLKNLLIILLVLFFGILVFFMGMHHANCYFMVQDGLQGRADVAFNEADPQELERFFSEKLLGKENFIPDIYDNYTISYYNYKLTVESLQVVPWFDTATVIVMEYVKDLEGEINEQGKSNQAAQAVPMWQPARYKVTLRRTGSYFSLQSHWTIESMELIEKVAIDPSTLVSVTPTPSPAEQTLPPAQPTPSLTAALPSPS
ncbi:MAG: hypothetical protein ACYCX2_05225 [Christensenellales bacterium]